MQVFLVVNPSLKSFTYAPKHELSSILPLQEVFDHGTDLS